MSLLQVNCFYTIHPLLCKQKHANLHIHLQYLLDNRSVCLKARWDPELSVGTHTNKKQSSQNPPRDWKKKIKSSGKRHKAQSFHNRCGLERSLRERSQTMSVLRAGFGKLHFISPAITARELYRQHQPGEFATCASLSSFIYFKLINQKHKVKRDKYLE